MTTTKNNKAARQAANAKIVAGINQNLAAMATITLNGTPYTPAQLTAVYTADSAAITASEAAHKTLAQCVLNETSVHATTAKVTSALRSFIIGYYGAEAVAVIGAFGLEAPKPTGNRSVATKALAAVKATATKKARGVQGSVQKLGVTGGVTTVVLTGSATGAKAAPGTPTGGAPAVTPSTAPSESAAAASPTPPAAPTVTAPKVGA